MENERDEGMIKEGTAVIEAEGGGIFCLSIIGQVEGHYVLDSSG